MPHNRPAGPDDGIIRPMGVVMAEERAREAKIIEERQIQNAKVLAEFNELQGALEHAKRDRIAYAKPCAHDEINVFQSFGSAQDDHETVYGECRACRTWVVSTLHFNGGGHIETRPMTPAELTKFRALEDRRRHEEWIHE